MDSMKQKTVSSLSFEQALQELEQIVEALERGEAPLEEAITLYERGAKLKAHCGAQLKKAHMRVEKIVLDAEDGPKTQPFQTEEQTPSR